MVNTTAAGEIVSINQADQFQWASGKPLSQYECGYYGTMTARSMAPVGETPTLTPQQIIAQAEAAYIQYAGNNLGTNTAGMSLQQLYSLLHQVGLHYQETALDVNTVKGWLRAGYPVILAIEEVSVRDIALGDTVPYPWNPAGNHIIVATGIAHNGDDLLVRDSANCTSLYNPNSLRPGPRTYDAAKLVIVSATVAVPPWLPRPASAIPPVVAPTPPATPPASTVWVSTAQKQAAQQEWISTAHLFGGIPPDYETGIALAWQANYRAGIFDGPPVSAEYGSVDWAGHPIRVMQFARKRYEWNGSKANRY